MFTVNMSMLLFHMNNKMFLLMFLFLLSFHCLSYALQWTMSRLRSTAQANVTATDVTMMRVISCSIFVHAS
jgi:hypothetical protein